MRLSPGYREWAPPRHLQAAIVCIWTRLAPEDLGETTLVLPDGCVDLIWQRDRGAFTAGPDTGPMPTVLEPGAAVVGARFAPGAGGPALRASMHELRDNRVEIGELDLGLARRLPAGMTAEVALARIVEVVSELVSVRPPDHTVRRAAALLAQPRTRLEEVQREVGLGERQLRRRFDAAVGYGPKTLQRILRFRRFLELLDAAGASPDLARAALDSGYADQAHMTRETTRLAGLPPIGLARRRTAATPPDLDA